MLLIKDANLLQKHLDRQIDACSESIKRARAAWLLGTILIYIVAADMLNSRIGWNQEQIKRRAILLSAVKSKDTFDYALKKAEDQICESKGPQDYVFIKVIFTDGNGELGYLKDLLPKDVNDAAEWKPLQKAVTLQLEEHVKRDVKFDTIELPFINLGVAGSDLGIIVGLGLSLIGLWLLAAVRRENHAISEFIMYNSDGTFSSKHSGYTVEQLLYAYKTIAHTMVFVASKRGSIPGSIHSLKGRGVPL
jgi:hypothetical protein